MEEKTLVTGRIRTSNIPSIVASVVALATLMYSIWSDNEVHGSFAHNCMDSFMLFFFVGIPMLILAAIFVLLMNNCSIVVTNKRIYGKASFGRRVDLPIDMISSTGLGVFNSITVSTSSGRIVFWSLSNRDEVYKYINKMIVKRQSAGITEKATYHDETLSPADELKKYKELLDMGAINQQEYDTVKRKLLNL